MSTKLVMHGVPHSDVFLSFSVEATENWVELHQDEEYVSKPGFVNCGGLTVCASGQGISRLFARELPSQHSALQNLGQPVYVQKFVRTLNPGELRVWVFGDDTWAAIAKKPRDGDWLTNTSRGATLTRVEVDREILDVSIRAARAIGAQLAGVDVVNTENGPIVFEVNTCPTFLPARELLGDDVPRKFAAFIARVLIDTQWRLT
jgi:glutathione synthase/RimK-type ligase-like ATP-grasp enzyme